MYLINKLKSAKWLSVVVGAIFSIAVTACSSGSSSSNSPTTLQISALSESTIQVGESTTATLSVTNAPSGESIIVAITNNNNSVINVTPHSCTLSAKNNSCTISMIGIGAGTASFSASSTSLATVTSNIITITPLPFSNNGILFGTQNGLFFTGESLIAGNAPLSGVDYSPVADLAVDSNNNLYAGTTGAVFGGFGAGKVFKYNSTLGYWNVLAGSGSGGSLDGSGVNVLVNDSNGNIYAGTNQGNVFKYTNGVWSLIAYDLNQPVMALAFDSSNNIYVGTNNGADVGDVFKYVDGVWKELGSPDSTGIQSIAISSSNKIYVATQGNGGDGQVYEYASGTSWTTLSTFNDGAINAVLVNGNNLYTGASTGKIYQYSGSGTAWTDIGTPDVLSSSAVMTMYSDGSNIYAGTYGDNYNGQVYRYASGTTWNKINTLNNGGISSIVIVNNKLYTSTKNDGDGIGNVYMQDSTVWSVLGQGAIDGTPVYSTHIASDGSYYVGTQSNVFKYITTTKSWQQLGYINSSAGISSVVTGNNNIYASALNGVIYLTNDSVINWTPIYSGTDEVVSDMLINSATLYASINYNDPNDQILKDGVVQVYNNSTGNWSKISGTAARGSLDGSPIQAITTDSANSLYAVTAGMGTGGYVWKHAESASGWTMVGFGTLDGTSINTVITDNNLNVYVGTTGGNIFKYNGMYWLKINTYPLDTAGISSLQFDNSNNLYATTYGGFIWEYIAGNSLWVNTGYGIGVSINNTGASGY